eukprot:scaffold29801_cov112-Isochrysis_galbana.AAC.1
MVGPPWLVSGGRIADGPAIRADRNVAPTVELVDHRDAGWSLGQRRVMHKRQDASLAPIGQCVGDAQGANVVRIDGQVSVDDQGGHRRIVFRAPRRLASARAHQTQSTPRRRGALQADSRPLVAEAVIIIY